MIRCQNCDEDVLCTCYTRPAKDIFLDSLIRRKRHASWYTDRDHCRRYYLYGQVAQEKDWIEIVW